MALSASEKIIVRVLEQFGIRDENLLEENIEVVAERLAITPQRVRATYEKAEKEGIWA